MKTPALPVRSLAALSMLVAAGTAMAQWSSDPTVNTVVADGSASQGTPIIRAAADGGAWIHFWESGAGPGLRPSIQRLKSDGNRAFDGNGIVLAARTNTASYTTDMRTDAAGNAYAAFDDNSTGTQLTRVHKILPDGTLAWGASGVAMPNSANSLNCRLAVCVDGTVVCMYQGATSTTLNLQRINADGTLGAAWTITEASRALSASDLQPGNAGGDVIAMWVRGETTSFTARKGLKIQKFNSAGAAQWNAGTPIDVYASGTSPTTRSIGNGYFPSMVSDSAGGAVIAWYDGGAARNAWLQHVLGDGTQRFAANGLAMSSTPSSTEYRLSASVGYDASQGDYVVAFETSNTLQSQFGLSAQHVSGDGTIDWGSSGRVLYPVVAGSNHKSFVNVQPAAGGTALVTWFDYQGANFPMHVKAARLDDTGANVWPSFLGVATSGSSKGRLGVTRTAGSDMFIVAFSDNGSGSDDIKAQNINIDGTLGMPAICYADFNRDGGIDGNDIESYFAAWESGGDSADVNRDGGVDGADVEVFFAAWEAGGC
ncbi:MAG: GC-type dockerin domain-anchored protein [Phycisphaerae bacterium]